MQLIFGLPKNMDGTSGFQADKVKELAAAVEELWGDKIIFVDERLTTVSANRALSESASGRKNRKQNVDQIAAVMILQSYLG